MVVSVHVTESQKSNQLVSLCLGRRRWTRTSRLQNQRPSQRQSRRQSRLQCRLRCRLHSPNHAMSSTVVLNKSSYTLALMSMEGHAMTRGTRALCSTGTAVHLQLNTFRAWGTGKTKEQQQQF